MTRSGRIQYDARGLTLAELAISMLLVGVMLVAALDTVGASTRTRRSVQDGRQGYALARALMAEIMSQTYADPEQIDTLRGEILVGGRAATVTLGPETGEATGNRSKFDDVDDYNGWNASPPQQKDGTVLSHLTRWRRQVSVVCTERDDFSEVEDDDEGAKLVTVRVLRDGDTVATLTALRTIRPPTQEACCLPDGSALDMPRATCLSLGGRPGGPGSNVYNSDCAPIQAIAHWRFDENTGTTAVDSSNGLNGTLVNGAAWNTGQLNAAVDLDGSDDYVSVPNTSRLSLSGQVTITAWIRPDIQTGTRTILIKGNYFLLKQTNYHLRAVGTEIVFGHSNLVDRTVSTTGANIASGRWHHVAVTSDLGTGATTIYINGVQRGAGVLGGSPVMNSDATLVGSTGFSERWDGRIDDLRIYGQFLTTDQIANVMSGLDP